MKLPIDKIIVPKRQRCLQKINEFAESIKEQGLINPITVNQNNELIAGLHRLEACKILGLKEINVNVINIEPIDAMLVEIDENYIRNEMTTIERTEALARRQELYERKYPQTKKGVAGGKASGKARRRKNMKNDTHSKVENPKSEENQNDRTTEIISAKLSETIESNLALKKEEPLTLSALAEQDLISPKIIGPGHPDFKLNADGLPDVPQLPKNEDVSFAGYIAKHANLTPKTIREYLSIARQITSDVRDMLRDTPIADRFSELRKISKLSPDKQRMVAQKIVSGKASNVRSALFQEEYPKMVKAAQEEAKSYPAKANIWSCEKNTFFEQLECYHFDLLITQLPSLLRKGKIINENFVSDVSDTLDIAFSRLNLSARAYLFVPSAARDFQIYFDMIEKNHFKLANVLAWTSPRVFRGKVNNNYRDNMQLIFHLYGPEAPSLHSEYLPELTTTQHVNKKIDYPFNVPNEIPERLIRHSTNPGDLVLDTFPRKGDFLLAAARLGREAFGFSENKFLVQDAVERGCTLK